MTGVPALEIIGLEVLYGGNRVLTVDRLTLKTGELLGVVGANGAGKSTLVNAAMGWSRGHPRLSGDVLLDGESIAALRSDKRAGKGLLLIPEGKLIFSSMSVEENLLDGAASTNGRRAYSIDEIFMLFPALKERRNHHGSQLSGGERQMLGIARALRRAPRVLLLDEPSIGLAPKLVSAVLSTVGELTADGLTVLLVEQNVKAAIKVVHRLALLERGHIVLDGPAASMRDDPRIAQAYLGMQPA